jgi:5-methylcytosine-specific restriction endonuclease McrA
VQYKEKYRLYLTQSPRWKKVRYAKLIESEFRCERCERSYDQGIRLEVHHKTYARVFHEALEDLEVLCNECHAWHHGHGAQPIVGRCPTTEELFRMLRG